MELFNCKWAAERYTTSAPECLNKNRVKYTCIESNNEFYPVGAVMDCADSENFDINPHYLPEI